MASAAAAMLRTDSDAELEQMDVGGATEEQTDVAGGAGLSVGRQVPRSLARGAIAVAVVLAFAALAGTMQGGGLGLSGSQTGAHMAAVEPALAVSLRDRAGGLVCQDTPGWTNAYSQCSQKFGDQSWCSPEGVSCAGYVAMGWCKNGAVQQPWAIGASYNWPEQHCCACGKQATVQTSGDLKTVCPSPLGPIYGAKGSFCCNGYQILCSQDALCCGTMCCAEPWVCCAGVRGSGGNGCCMPGR